MITTIDIVKFNNYSDQTIDGKITSATSNHWIPTFTSISGIVGSPSLKNAFYNKTNNVIICGLDFIIDINDSNIMLGISVPITANFTANDQAILLGQYAGDEMSPNIGDGVVNDLYSDDVNQRLNIGMLFSVGSGSKHVILSYQYEIQP